jgi:hypothetical protein
MIDRNDALDEIEEETTENNCAPDRPEGNEAGVLREYSFSLEEGCLTEGLIFQEEATLITPPRRG